MDSADEDAKKVRDQRKRWKKEVSKQDSVGGDNPSNLLQVVDKTAANAVNNAARELRRNYSKKVSDKLAVLTKNSLKILSKYFAAASMDAKIDEMMEENSVNSIVFVLTAFLSVPEIEVRPSIDEVQTVLVQAGKIIMSVSKGVSTWRKGEGKPKPVKGQKGEKGKGAGLAAVSETAGKEMKLYTAKKEEKPVITEKPTNFYKVVAESKEVSKMYSMLSGCMQGIKMEFSVFSKIWNPYRHVWEIDREDTIAGFVKKKPKLKHFEDELSKYNMAKSQLTTEKLDYQYGSILIDCKHLKETIDMEISQWISVYGKAMQVKYKREMDFIVAQVADFDRKLDRPINDLDDIRIIMETQKKIRDQEIDMDMKIDLVEEAFSLLAKYKIQLTKEEVDKVESLEYNWLQLQGKAMDVQILLLTVQEHFQKELISNLEVFQDDCGSFVAEYNDKGPMQPGLTPREASDRLQMFQNHFDALWRKHSSYTIGEDLFGLPHSEQPELNKIKKELNLLQRLYKLYNDVIDSVNNYHNIPWQEVNIEDINNELLEFQNRCRKLPKALKEWPAFHALKKTIDDFNDICPLLELMSNKAMKYRHWQKIQQITGFTFDLERPGFCLKDILEAPLLPNKEDIEDVCISALKEKDIEAKLRQVTVSRILVIIPLCINYYLIFVIPS